MPAPDDNMPDIVALIPSAGRATRIAPLPCSKEIFPLGLAHLEKTGSVRPKVVCHYLLEKMRLAGAKKGFIIVRHGKWDIPGYCGSGSFVDMDLAYLLVESSLGPPYSVDQAYPFVQHARIVFGFPDILFQPDDVFIRLLEKHKMTHADVVLGLFPTRDHQQMDMVQTQDDGRVAAMYLKPERTDLCFAWVCAVWSEKFTGFMHDYLHGVSPGLSAETANVVDAKGGVPRIGEISVGHVLQAALKQGIHIQSVAFPTGSYIDIGTPEGLNKALLAVLTEGNSVSS
jgi:glucose-1-phosphate thymidylyltransferase